MKDASDTTVPAPDWRVCCEEWLKPVPAFACTGFGLISCTRWRSSTLHLHDFRVQHLEYHSELLSNSCREIQWTTIMKDKWGAGRKKMRERGRGRERERERKILYRLEWVTCNYFLFTPIIGLSSFLGVQLMHPPQFFSSLSIVPKDFHDTFWKQPLKKDCDHLPSCTMGLNQQIPLPFS